MNKVVINIKNKQIIFDLYKDKDDEEILLNNTNVIDVKNLKFSEEYIFTNLNLTSSYLNLLILKENVDTLVIRNLKIFDVVLELIKYLKNIESIIFSESKKLDYQVASKILEIDTLKVVNCYDLPEIMFSKYSNKTIQTRSEIINFSNFFEENDIKTYSDVCKMDKIQIDLSTCNKTWDDLNFFLENNFKLKNVIIFNYHEDTFNKLLVALKDNNFKNLTIIIKTNELIDLKKYVKETTFKMYIVNEKEISNFKSNQIVFLLPKLLFSLISILVIIYFLLKKVGY